MPLYFLPRFESTGPLVQETKGKINFQDGCHGDHLEFPIGMLLAIFDLQAAPILPIRFGSTGLLVPNWFLTCCHGGHLGFLIWTILAIFDLQVALILPIKFCVNRLFNSGEEAKNRFSRWRPSWISDQNNFSYFWSTSQRCFLPSFESIGHMF